MAEGETNTGGQGRPPKQPYGPGLLMVFGLALLGLALWCTYDLFIAQKGEGDATFQAFNYGGMIAGAVAGVYCLILAAIRSKKGMPDAAAPAPERVRMDEPPSDSGAAEARPSDAPAGDAAPGPGESDE